MFPPDERFDARFGLMSWLLLRDLGPGGVGLIFGRTGDVSLDGLGVLPKDGPFESGFSLLDADAAGGRAVDLPADSSSASFEIDAPRFPVDMATTWSSSEGMVRAESQPRLLRQLDAVVHHAVTKLWNPLW